MSVFNFIEFRGKVNNLIEVYDDFNEYNPEFTDMDESLGDKYNEGYVEGLRVALAVIEGKEGYESIDEVTKSIREWTENFLPAVEKGVYPRLEVSEFIPEFDEQVSYIGLFLVQNADMGYQLFAMEENTHDMTEKDWKFFTQKVEQSENSLSLPVRFEAKFKDYFDEE